MEYPGTHVVTSQDLRAIVQAVGADHLIDALIQSLTVALQGYDGTQTHVIKRHGFAYDRPHTGVLEWMPAMDVGHRAALKVVAYNPSNPAARGLPTIVSTINLYDIATGRLVALMDGVLPTALRTGAASAIATRILARPGSSTVGLVGCGAQAVTQLHALTRVLHVERVLVHDIDSDATASFAHRVSFLGLPVHTASRATVEQESDVICTATSADVGAGPVVDDRHLKPWVHVNAVGSDLPGKTELPAAFLRRSFVCPDFVAQALTEGEAQQLAVEDLGPSLSELVRDADAHTHQRERSTVFDSTGFVVEDTVVADLFLRHAADMGLGRTLMIEGVSGDPKNPYTNLDLSPNRNTRLAVGRCS